MIVFECPSCRAELEADLEFAGETIECPSCHHSAVVPAGAIAQGTMIAGYQVERHLGGGSLGEVYVATQLSVERRVALKILPPALAQHAALTAAFLREARALARLDHPGVVAVLDAGSDSGCFYLAAPLIEGEDLARRVERQGRLAEAEAVHVALEIARVLASCWDKFAVAHLDLKPANIMVDTDGHIRLLDLGLTGHLFSDPDAQEVARTLLISPYVSPEQLEGRSDLDFRCDLYALGTCLYYLTTGRSPFQETGADELASRVLNQQFPPARETNPSLSKAFDQLIADLTVKDQHRRPAGWDHVIQTLEGMETSKAAPAPRRGAAPRRAVISKPGAAPAHVIRLKPADQVHHHRVASSGPSAAPWIIGILLALAVGGTILGLKSRKNREDLETHLATAQAAAGTGQDDDARQRAADLVKAARVYVETYPRDISGGRGQVRAAREQLVGSVHATALAPELEAVERLLEERERPPTQKPTPAPAPDTEAGAPPAGAAVADAGSKPPAPTPAAPTAAKSAGPITLIQSAARLLERDFAGAGALLPAEDGKVDNIDVAVLRKELAELARWADQVYAGLRETISREQELRFRDGPRALVIKSVNPPQVRAERITRDGDRVVGRTPANFRLEDLGTEELIKQLHGERGGVSALMCGVIAYRSGELGEARAWFNRTTSPWAPLVLRAMDGDPVAAP